MDEPPQSNRTAMLMAVTSITLFSAKPIFIKWAYTYGMDAESLMFWRMILSAPFFLLVGLWGARHYRLQPRDLLIAAGLGLLGSYVSGLLDMLGLEYISAQLERMLLFTYPIFTVLLAWLCYGRPMHRYTLICMALSYTGLAFMFMMDFSLQGSHIVLGTGLVLLAAFTFASYMLMSRAPIQRMGSLAFTAVVMLSSTAMMSAHIGLQQAPAFDLAGAAWPLWAIVAGLVLFCTVIPAFLGSEAVKRLGPEQVSLLGNAGPMITTLLAVLLLDEAFSLAHGIGMALVLAGIWVLQQPQDKPLLPMGRARAARKATGC